MFIQYTVYYIYLYIIYCIDIYITYVYLYLYLSRMILTYAQMNLICEVIFFKFAVIIEIQSHMTKKIK